MNDKAWGQVPGQPLSYVISEKSVLYLEPQFLHR